MAQPAWRPSPMTLDEWAALEEDVEGEWEDGFLVEEEMPSIVHEAIVSWLIRALGAVVVPRGGWVFGSEAKYAVSARRGRKPDVAVYLPGSRPPPRYGVVRVPPDIVVEVLSPTPGDQRRDRIAKHDEYAAFGVRFYWLVDPEARTLEIFERTGDGRYVVAAHGADGKLDGRVEGVAVDLDALWAEVDRLPAEE